MNALEMSVHGWRYLPQVLTDSPISYTLCRQMIKRLGIELQCPRPIKETIGSHGVCLLHANWHRKQAGVAPGMTLRLQEQFTDLVCRLSPENLSCDGELSGPAIMRRREQINADWAQLEAQAGCRVSEDEVWNWSLNS